LSVFIPPVKPVEQLRHDYSAGPDCQIFLNDAYLDEVAMARYQVRGTKRPVYGYHQPHYSTVLKGKETVHGQLITYRVVDNYLARMAKNENIVETGFRESNFQSLQAFLNLGALLPMPDWVRNHLYTRFNVKTADAFDKSIERLRQLDDKVGMSDSDVVNRKQLIQDVNRFKEAVYEAFKQPTELNSGATKPKFALPDLTNISATGISASRSKLDDFALAPFKVTAFFGVFGDVDADPLRPTTVGTIEDCVLTGHRQSIQPSAEVLAVSYEFIGKSYTEQVF